MDCLIFVGIVIYIALGYSINQCYYKDRHEILEDEELKKNWLKSELQFYASEERILSILKAFADAAGFIVALLWPVFMPFFLYSEYKERKFKKDGL